MRGQQKRGPMVMAGDGEYDDDDDPREEENDPAKAARTRLAADPATGAGGYRVPVA
jgi:hypothetical protein